MVPSLPAYPAKKARVVLRRAFALHRASEAAVFASEITNRKLLFHGSRRANWLGILSRGLMLPRSVLRRAGTRTDAGMLGAGTCAVHFIYWPSDRRLMASRYVLSFCELLDANAHCVLGIYFSDSVGTAAKYSEASLQVRPLPPFVLRFALSFGLLISWQTGVILHRCCSGGCGRLKELLRVRPESHRPTRAISLLSQR